MNNLNEAFQKISQEMYKNSANTDQQTESGNKEQDSASDGATDADYEVVDEEKK